MQLINTWVFGKRGYGSRRRMVRVCSHPVGEEGTQQSTDAYDIPGGVYLAVWLVYSL